MAAHRPAQGRARHHRLPHHALPGGSGRPVRPGLHHRPRGDRGRGHARRAQAADLRRRGDAAGDRRRSWQRCRPQAARRPGGGPRDQRGRRHAQADRGARRAGAAVAAPGARRGGHHAGIDQLVPAHAGRRVPHPDRALAARRLPGEPRGPPGRRDGQGVVDVSFIRDTMLVFRRQERLALRQPAWVIIGLTQPILYLALFGPLLKGLPGASLGASGNAYRFFVPGLLIQLGLFGSTFVGFAIISDWRGGVVVLVGVAFGLRAPVAAVFIGFGFIVLVAIGLASVSYATGLLVKSEDAFAPLINTIVVPLLLLSGIFLPLTLGPGWLQGIARISPFRYIIDAMREAYLGHYFNTIMVEGIAVAAGMAALFLWLGSRVFVQENA